MNLTQIPVGEWVTVIELQGPQTHTERLMELGLLAGRPVRVRSCAPLGGPVIVEFGGTVVALRREEAAWIQVQSNPS